MLYIIRHRPIWWVLLAVLACRPADSAEEVTDSVDRDSGDSVATEARAPDLALVADSSTGRYLYVRLNDATLVHTLDLAAINPGRCGDALCVAYVGWPSVDPVTGADEATITFTPTDDDANIRTLVQRVRLDAEGGTVQWGLTQLDFLSNFADQPEICAQTVSCEIPEDLSAKARRGCQLSSSHEVRVVEEDAAQVVMWIADTMSPARALKVRLDKDSECGVVEEVVSAETAEPWAGYQAINDVDPVDLGDGDEAVLVSTLSSDGLDGLSNITLWQKQEGVWTRRWQYPEDGFLSAVHNPDWIVGEDGQSYLVYAHGNGAGQHNLIDDYAAEVDELGTIGVARVDESGPTYLFDAVIPEGFGFLRDVNVLEDGTFLVTDSGCISHKDTSCDKEGRLWHVVLPDLATVEASGLGGAFDGAHADMVLVEARVLETRFDQPLEAGFDIPYTAMHLPVAGLGSVLGVSQ